MQRMLSTSDFAAAIGISESSVRRLADSGDLEIHRTRGGHRRIPVAEAIRYVRETGAQVLEPQVLGLIRGESTDDLPGAEQLITALCDGNARAVIGIMRQMYASGVSLAELCDGAVRDAMIAIGNRWPTDKRSIFVEHRATLLCVRALCQLRLAVPELDEGAPTAMGAAPQDDPYLLPSMMVSLVLHDCGYEDTNLGPNTPLDVLTDSVEEEQPNLVWLALSNPIRSRHQNREVERLAEAVQDYGGVFLIGGKNAHTYEGKMVQRCGTMAELRRMARAFNRRSDIDSPIPDHG
ncbi:MAG: helix-turn-helix domain-containing protein [Planctomycetota bacterium]